LDGDKLAGDIQPIREFKIRVEHSHVASAPTSNRSKKRLDDTDYDDFNALFKVQLIPRYQDYTRVRAVQNYLEAKASNSLVLIKNLAEYLH